MSRARPTDLTASVRQRLLNLSRERREDFNRILMQYANERFLYRLSKSVHADRFILKGATLFALWIGQPYRPTRDLDLIGYGSPSEEALASLVRDVCDTAVEADGLTLETSSIRMMQIRGEQEYPGQRVRLIAKLGKAKIPLQVDIAFGDVIVPVPQEVDYPTLLPFPAPRLRAYPKETVVTEKLQTMVALGIANSRMKDFYDVWLMANLLEFQGAPLVEAIRATFERRKTQIPEAAPIALTAEFAEAGRDVQWRAFLRRNRLDAVEFKTVIKVLNQFLMPALSAAATGEEFQAAWPPKGPWRQKRSDNSS